MSARGKGQKPDLVDQAAIAERLGVGTSTVSRWFRRSVLPPPDLRVGTTDLWFWEAVHKWAGQRSRSIWFRKTRTRRTPPDVVDLVELASRLGVSSRTAATWQRSELLPKPDYEWETTQAWLWTTIERWSVRGAGRIPGLFRPDEPAPVPSVREPSGPRLSGRVGSDTAEAPSASTARSSAAGDDGGTVVIRPVATPKPGATRIEAADVAPARERSADPIGDIDRIQKYFAAMAETWGAPVS